MSNVLVTAIKQLQKGRPVIILDDSKRENEGDLVVAAEVVNTYAVNFMVKHSSGVICVAATEEQLNKLKLSKITSKDHKADKLSTPFTLSCEASKNIGTGISAIDRAESIRVIGNPNSTHKDIVVPGHIFPLIADNNGLKSREGHTEASVELCKLANLWPAAAIVEISNENGSMMKGESLEIFAKTYDLPLISIKEIKQAIESNLQTVFPTAASNLPTSFGDFTINIWTNVHSNKEHIVLTKGDIKEKEQVPVRIHSQCLTGDVFHSLKCDCGEQLEASLQYISENGNGILLWLRQEGRGIGLTNKIKAYHLQDTLNLDTVEANLRLNLPIDARKFDEAVEIINYYNPKSIQLLTNNPQKVEEMKQYLDKDVTRRELIIKANPKNDNYLKVKQHKLKHMLNIKDDE